MIENLTYIKKLIISFCFLTYASMFLLNGVIVNFVDNHIIFSINALIVYFNNHINDIVCGLAYLILINIFVLKIQNKINGFIKNSYLLENVKNNFFKYNNYTYLILLSSIGTLWGISLNFVFLLLNILCIYLLQLIIILCSSSETDKKNITTSQNYIMFLFAISGFAALIYQITWQKVLFATFGLDSQSVTIIVSIFMLGIGLGALAGGEISKKYDNILIQLFIIIEILIGVFGIFSIKIIELISSMFHGASHINLIIGVYIILGIPTFLMGATLPILVSYFQKKYKNIGVTVGLLYASNTIGSAIAAFLTVNFLFILLGKQATIFVAVGFNFLTAYLIYYFHKHLIKKNNFGTEDNGNDVNQNLIESSSQKIPLILTLIISFIIGYVSLSQEILWFRFFNILTATASSTFGIMLSVFLLGIGCGSLKSKKMCQNNNNLIRNIINILILSLIIYLISMPILSYVSKFWYGLSFVIGLIFVYITSYLLGSILPIVSHIGIHAFSKNVSQKVSWIYFSNIIGSTLGCILTGFYFLDILTFSQNIMLVCSTLSILIFLMLFFYKSKRQSFMFCIVSVLLINNQDIFYSNFYQNIQGHKYFDISEKAKYILENKAGVITVFNDKNGDWIFGNGAYDGKFNIDPVINSNDIIRAYKTVILHPEPKNILMIGLSSGSWAKAISMYQPLKKLDIVEINSGYKEIISNYQDINDIFNNPKVTLYLDDGRKWLKKYNGKKFDLIVMNTIYHWANNATNLISQDFLKITKKYLNQNGIIYMNTTGAEDVAYTASSVFKYTTMINNLVAVSDSPFHVSVKKRKENLQKFIYSNGNLVFDDNNPKLKKISDQIIATQLIDYNSSLKNRDDLWLITDDNMAGEYKKYHHFYQPKYNLKYILNNSK